MTDGPPRAYVDIHILQTVPPANLNRDDQGNPKEAMFGGVRRSRVSSQAWKRATRMHFTDLLPKERLATRTRQVSAALAERIGARYGLPGDRSARLAEALLVPLGLSAGKKDGDTAYLFFYGRDQLDSMAGLIADRFAELDAADDGSLAKEMASFKVQEAFKKPHPLDVALFGRMVADVHALKVDAATQVAHALSTHAVELEFDYFTAVDDRTREDNPGAGMIGTIGFNSATLYRYATVGFHQLYENLGDHPATVEGVRSFVNSFARSVPSGYVNSFAHRTLPSLVAVVVRDDQPVNLVSAFEKPVGVSPTGRGISEQSADRLAAEHSGAVRNWGDLPSFTSVCHAHTDAPGTAERLREAFGEPVDFPTLLSGLSDHLTALTRAPR
ncbi:type I-E CRISPR-associated protein Cas7/Cse4/CasC [Streptomyces sp. NPDC000594]|uniref:type I-E CRISPR-associated protein Cas7/Cse4/CasC n=1 Tax=Streptomyces sp. NPDC000594 TaxID=3154261 RepID=UPI00331D7B9A